MKAAIVVQARMSSRRLPGKVLMPLAGEPAIVRLMERVGRVKRADLKVLATSVEPSDDVLARTARERGIEVARGSLDDVLARVLDAVPPDYDIVVRLTGDCPLLDPDLVDRHIEVYRREHPAVQYVTNTWHRTHPDGLDVQVVSRGMLEEAYRHASSAYDREHVLPWVAERAEQVASLDQETDLSALRWTLDTKRDYETISAIYDALHPGRPDFGADDVYRLLVQRPDLIHVEGDAPLTREEEQRWAERIQTHLDREAAKS